VWLYRAHDRQHPDLGGTPCCGRPRSGCHVVPYDPDLLAEARRYNEIALQGASWSFRVAVANWLAAVEEAEPAGVVILHSERGTMELADVVASNAHDAFHHCWDVARILRSP
jgi:hypothetical protein